MAAYYCDSSALVKRYVRETGSRWLLTNGRETPSLRCLSPAWKSWRRSLVAHGWA
jgi:hypothetical protein